MEKSTITLTRKIQLVIDVSSEDKSQIWEKLYRYQNRCFRAANLIVSHLYVQEMIKDFFYLTEEIQYKLSDEKKMKWESSTVQKQTPRHVWYLTVSREKSPPIFWDA